MKTTSETNSRNDGIVCAIGVLAMLLGTATGNAYAMLAISVVALVVIAIFCRQALGRNALLAMVVAAATAAVIGFAITKF